MIHPTYLDYTKSNYIFESDFYFENYYIGQVYRNFTDYIKQCGILLQTQTYDNNRTTFVKNSGYLPHIIHFGVGIVTKRNDLYKITWDFAHTDGTIGGSGINYEQIKYVAEYFCVDGWEDEDAINFGDIKNNTKHWVDYLTFQGSRMILQFYLDDYIIYLRKQKMNSLYIYEK